MSVPECLFSHYQPVLMGNVSQVYPASSLTSVSFVAKSRSNIDAK